MATDQTEKGRPLTDTQIAYLTGTHTPPNDNAEYQIRSKIRSRIEGALKDFVRVRQISDNDAQSIFEDFENISEVKEKGNGESRLTMPGHLGSVSNFLSFAYRGYRANGMDPERFVSLVVKDAIRAGEADFEGVDPSQVQVDIELENIEVYRETDEIDALEKLEKGLGLTPDEWRQLGKRLKQELDRESIPIDEMPDLARQHLLDDSGE